jgi:hypothetical protein
LIVHFSSHEKITEKNKEGKIYFGSWFQKFQFMVGWLLLLGLKQSRNIITIMAEGHGEKKLFISRWPGNRDRER